ncbi:MAG: phospho-sugar mutase, partial [Paludibacteraceae bacterium]|nr:phospho-sugar mutase [Paludibacteraceae bacterium]
AGSQVIVIKDYDTLRLIDVSAGTTNAMEMPETSNVLQFFTAEGTKISVRPSGTEPKIKFYIEVRGELKNRKDYEKANQVADEKIKAVMASLKLD